MRNKAYPLYKIENIANLKKLVNYTAEKYNYNTAFSFERKKELIKISYWRFKIDVDALGTAFYDLGIKNAKVAVIGENSYEWILTYFAVVNSGNVIVPLDKELPAKDINFLLEESDTEMLVFSDEFSDVAEYLQKNNANIQHYINMEKDMPDLIENGGFLVSYGDKTIVDYEIDNKAVAALLYTSGTTGTAKGVMLTHYGLAQNARIARQFIYVHGKSMLVLPLHHSFGFTGGIIAMMLSGVHVFINSSLKDILTDLEKSKPHNILLVPLFVESFYRKIWDGSKKQGKERLLKKLIGISNLLLKLGIDLRRFLFKSVLRAFGGNLSLIISGGAPIDEKYIKGFRDFGINVLNGYGITECSPIVSVNRNQYYRDGSIGQVLPNCEVKIIKPDENGNGEICVKGDIVMLGYYRNEQATKEAFDGEWFKTGDIGYLDEDGFLFITGRKKNLIILNNGKNVYPEEIELDLLNYIPYIKEAVIYSENGMIIAEVFLDTENGPDCASRLDGDIVEFNRTLASYKNIGRTVVRDTEFPKTTTKKIKREYK